MKINNQDKYDNEIFASQHRYQEKKNRCNYRFKYFIQLNLCLSLNSIFIINVFISQKCDK